MPLRERMAEMKKQIPAALGHQNVQMLTNPSSSGKKAKELATKVYVEFLKNEKYLDASVAAAERVMRSVPTAALEEQDALFKHIESLFRQCRGAQKVVAKNIGDLEKALKEIKKAYKV